MHTLRLISQQLRSRNTLRLFIIAIFALILVQYYMSQTQFFMRQDPTSKIFMGTFRVPDDKTALGILVNLYPFVFALVGMAIPLEQFSEFLCIPNYFVYIRQQRGYKHFCKYLCIVLFYCILFTGIQFGIATVIIPQADIAKLISGSIFACWTLFNSFLIANAAYLVDQRAIGYFTIVLLDGLLVSFTPALLWLQESGIGNIPNWVPVFAVFTVILILLNSLSFRYLEIR